MTTPVCACGLGRTDKKSRRWNHECPVHGVQSDWYRYIQRLEAEARRQYREGKDK